LLDQILSIRRVCLHPFELTVASEIPSNTPTDYTEFTKNATFEGLRLGVPRKLFFDLEYVEHPEIIEAVNSAIHNISSMGAEIEDPTDFAIPDNIDIVQQMEAFVCRPPSPDDLTGSHRFQS
jgi:Asp-tRNA(Asn)/Glu-tRNA(Gln) amidotransferase A subunit family amidase